MKTELEILHKRLAHAKKTINENAWKITLLKKQKKGFAPTTTPSSQIEIFIHNHVVAQTALDGHIKNLQAKIEAQEGASPPRPSGTV